MATEHSPEEQDAFARGYYDIPALGELRSMSFVELAELLSSCAKNSPKFLVVEHELKNRFAKDQAKINLPNMLWAAALAGVFAIAGAVVGAIIRGLPPASPAVAAPMKRATPPAENTSTPQSTAPQNNAQTVKP